MKFHDINQAIAKAGMLHEGQRRKGIPLPYLVHPFAVAAMLAFYTNDKDVIVAGLMHDTVEDTDYTFKDLEDDFGERVCQIVQEVTEIDVEAGRLSWKPRKEEYLKRLDQASFEGLEVCCADKVHNLMSLVDSFNEHGDKFWDSFAASPSEILWFYSEVLKKIKKRLPHIMIKKYIEALEKAGMVLNSAQKRINERQLAQDATEFLFEGI